jgi:hypothetical protein
MPSGDSLHLGSRYQASMLWRGSEGNLGSYICVSPSEQLSPENICSTSKKTRLIQNLQPKPGPTVFKVDGCDEIVVRG